MRIARNYEETPMLVQCYALFLLHIEAMTEAERRLADEQFARLAYAMSRPARGIIQRVREWRRRPRALQGVHRQTMPQAASATIAAQQALAEAGIPSQRRTLVERTRSTCDGC
jgi:hypothetical protein